MAGIVCVPVENGRCVLAHTSEIILLMVRDTAGWSTTSLASRPRLPHQVSIDAVNFIRKHSVEICEIVAVGLTSGQWQTIWCDSDSHRSF